MTVISPEVAELLERRKTETQELASQSRMEYDDLMRRVKTWAQETAVSRVALARLQYTLEKHTLVVEEPAKYYQTSFPLFHEWLAQKSYELLRMSAIRQMFSVDIEQARLLDIMDVVRNNTSMHYLPRLVLVEDDAGDFAIVCRGD